MKSLRRTSLAAALLMAPFSAALIATPAAAQHTVAVAPAALGALALHADAGLAPGSTLRLELSAAPGARWVEVDLGADVRVALRERHAGHYVGSHVVRQSDRIDPLRPMTARVHHAGGTVVRDYSYPAAFQAMARDGVGDRRAERGRGQRRWDREAPQITEVSPQAAQRMGERGWTRISARVADAGSGVDASSVTLRVDGRDVSADTRLQGDEVRYRADLAPGRHTAELTVRDRAGNASTRSWSFGVLPAERYGHYDGRR